VGEGQPSGRVGLDRQRDCHVILHVAHHHCASSTWAERARPPRLRRLSRCATAGRSRRLAAWFLTCHHPSC
jgi:hypothetical protein